MNVDIDGRITSSDTLSDPNDRLSRLSYPSRIAPCATYNAVQFDPRNSGTLNQTIIAVLNRDSSLRREHLRKRWQHEGGHCSLVFNAQIRHGFHPSEDAPPPRSARGRDADPLTPVFADQASHSFR